MNLGRGLKSLVMATIALGFVAGCSGQADEQVTDADRPSAAQYRQAVEQTRDCVEDAGYETGPIGVGVDGLTLSFEISVPPGAEEAIDTAYSDCEAQYLSEIALAYLGGRHLTGEAREQAMQELVDCLNDAGVTGLDVAETDSREFVKAIMSYGEDSPQAYDGLECFDRYRDVWPPGDANNP